LGLVPGSRLGAHEILGLLGSGGMGEVYRAQDTRLASSWMAAMFGCVSAATACASRWNRATRSGSAA
jgi:hypothetical protein